MRKFFFRGFLFLFPFKQKKYCMMAEITQSKQKTDSKRLNWKTSPTSKKLK